MNNALASRNDGVWGSLGSPRVGRPSYAGKKVIKYPGCSILLCVHFAMASSKLAVGFHDWFSSTKSIQICRLKKVNNLEEFWCLRLFSFSVRITKELDGSHFSSCFNHLMVRKVPHGYSPDTFGSNHTVVGIALSLCVWSLYVFCNFWGSSLSISESKACKILRLCKVK